jgi:WD40 repeat protein
MDKDKRPRVFICYSLNDANVANRIDQELGRYGIDTFVDRRDISPGEEWTNRLASAIRDANAVVVLLTASSAHSPSVVREISLAADQGKRIIPLVHRSLELKDWPLELRERQALIFDDDKSLGFVLEGLSSQLFRYENSTEFPGGYNTTRKVEESQNSRGSPSEQTEKPNIFIGYSREDIAFAKELHQALYRAGFATSGDLRSISAGEEWRRSLVALIRDADSVVFVLSPSSVRSEIMAWEAAEAVRLGKRVFPVVCRPLDGAKPPTELDKINWVFFYEGKLRGENGFDAGLKKLVLALNTDLDWLRENTHYQNRAAEWNAAGRLEGRLLVGADIAAAKAWATRRPADAPELTSLQLEFIEASEAADIRRNSAEAERLREMADAKRRDAKAQRMRRADDTWASREDELRREAEAQRSEKQRGRRVEWLKRAGLAAVMVLAVVAGVVAVCAHRQRQVALPPRDILAAAFVLINVAAIGVLLVWRKVRPTLLWALATLGVPVAAALMIDALRGHAMRVILPHAAPIAAMTVSRDESLLAVADQDDFVGITRTDSEVLNLTTTAGRARALYFVMRDAGAATLETPQLVVVDNAADFKLCDFISGRIGSIGPCNSVEVQQQQVLQQQVQQGHQPRSIDIFGWTYVASAMNKNGIVAAVRAGSRGDPKVEDKYEIRFSNRRMPPLALAVRPTAIAAYEGTLAGTAISEATSQPFLLGFEDGNIGLVLHDTGHGVRLVQGAAPARNRAALRPIVKLASSPSNRIASVHSDGAITVWALDEKSGKPLMSENLTTDVQGLKGAIRSASFSADDKRIVAASDDKTARLWDAATAKEIAVLRGHDEGVSSAAFSPDGTRIVTASDDKTARQWDAATAKEIAVLRGHDEGVSSAAFSPDGTRIVTASSDKTARLWDAATAKEIAVLRGHDEGVSSAAFSPDGTRIVTASDDKTARLWDAETGKPIGEPLIGHEGPVFSAMFSPDGKRIVTASDDKTARLWDAETGKPIGEPLIGHEGPVFSAAFSPDGKRIVTASGDKTARLWDTDTGKPIGEPLIGHEDSVLSAAFSPDGKRIVTASLDKTARLWDAATGLLLETRCRGCAFLDIDETTNTVEVVDSVGRDTWFSMASGQLMDSRSLDHPLDGTIFFDGAHHSILTSLVDGTVNSTADGSLPVHSALVAHAIFLKDGRIVTGAIDGSVRIINPMISTRLNLLDLGQYSLQYYFRLSKFIREATRQRDLTILIVRHAEKPPSGPDLSPAGVTRAAAYAKYFNPFSAGPDAAFAPDSLIASSPTPASNRPVQTLKPLSAAIGVPIDERFASVDVRDLAETLRSGQRGKHILIAWHHEQIPELIQALGGDPSKVLPGGVWPARVYDWVVELNFDSNGRLMDERKITENLPM